MATIYTNPSLNPGHKAGDSYSGYKEPDTSVPPKAKPVTRELSVNGVVIEESELLAEAQNHPAENPGQALAEAARALVIRELLWQEAMRLDVNATPATDGQGRLEEQKDAAIRVLIEQQVDVPSADDRACRRYYDQNPERFSSEALIEARHILLAAPPDNAGARKEKRALAEQLISRLKEHPEEFQALARSYSDCPSKEHGGNLGQLSRGSTVREFEKAVARMNEGDMSQNPVESRFGFHIVLIERKVPGRRLPYEMVRERIGVWLEAGTWSKAVSQYISILAGCADIRGVNLEAGDGPLVQ
ncbi:peptidylprolyl isomerase [Hoeflea prorocentri]|uniref:Parvulin-like PPIase n=1 Tax=Hoeflea prorocentri TaxID=1922333 RepID=A0A9X3UF02_9HYPH|nr:peptidylprolyl isomerase [Hoeflea prorocentri]MCY6380163.1 peptidylprolyl isomerase [Hoeflea prorocentri]MDA5397963.1 peptidylprolyl isomerase [Hoeflea prorocentri]